MKEVDDVSKLYISRRKTRNQNTDPAGIATMKNEGCAIRITHVEKEHVIELLDVNVTTIGDEIFVSSDEPFYTPVTNIELFNFNLIQIAKNQNDNGNH